MKNFYWNLCPSSLFFHEYFHEFVLVLKILFLENFLFFPFFFLLFFFFHFLCNFFRVLINFGRYCYKRMFFFLEWLQFFLHVLSILLVFIISFEKHLLNNIGHDSSGELLLIFWVFMYFTYIFSKCRPKIL